MYIVRISENVKCFQSNISSRQVYCLERYTAVGFPENNDILIFHSLIRYTTSPSRDLSEIAVEK